MGNLNTKSGKAMLSFRYTLLQCCSYNDVPTSVFVATTMDLTKCVNVLESVARKNSSSSSTMHSASNEISSSYSFRLSISNFNRPLLR